MGEPGSSTGSNNGNLTKEVIVNNESLNATQTFGYDAYNRVQTAQEDSTWSQTYGYDQFGNRSVSSNGGANPYPLSTFTPTLSSNYNPKNQLIIQGSAYDLDGNQQAIGGFGFTWDGENRLLTSTLSSATTQYTYDGEGRRVMKATGANTTNYVYDAAGQLVLEETRENVPATGTQYLTDDHLGSTRVVTDQHGTVQKRYDYLPFGEEIWQGMGVRGADYDTPPVYGATQEVANSKFTGKVRDDETGWDYFGARYFSGQQGRFTGPDEFKGGIVDPFTGQDIETNTALPYADITDPQTLNKYAYVANNPLRYVDPNGHVIGVDDLAEWALFTATTAAVVYYGEKLGESVNEYYTSQTKASMEAQATFANQEKAAPPPGLPANPDTLKDKGYHEISHPKAAEAGHRTFENQQIGDKVRFDKGKPGAQGHEGTDHYHRYNPKATGKADQYLDASGNPVARGSEESHLKPDTPPPPRKPEVDN
ncbi:MAG TPA: RHS repeat-associated core domain-containing protein [Bryobacteraceae bacterium]|nr:RHS repeat-associated core domain-containing protein [Bryobacteraceae bacterium]